MRALLAVLLLLTLAFAGCSSQGGGGDANGANRMSAGRPVAAEESAAPTQSEESARGEGSAAQMQPVTFTGCMGFSFTSDVPADWVQDDLPPGYIAWSDVGVGVDNTSLMAPLGLSPVYLGVVRCDTVSFPDGTTYREPLLALSMVELKEANGNDGEGSNLYVFEVFLDVEAVPALATHFRSVDWPLHDAAIALKADTFQVQAEGIDYRGTVGAEEENTSPLTAIWVGGGGQRTFHHVGRAPSLGTVGEDRSEAAFTITLEAQGGFFGGLTPAGSLAPLKGLGMLWGFEGGSDLQWAGGAPPP
jgi:hypothetical protein